MKRTGFVLILALGLLSSLSVSSFSEREQLQDALRLLGKSPTGKKLIERAMRTWGVKSADELQRVFKWGEVSRTDAVLTRNYHPDTGRETRSRQVTVYFRKNQATEDLVLDMAHELTHATEQPAWDPYDPSLTAAKYVLASLEGEGGEVQALMTECQVASELSIHLGFSAARCLRYREFPSGEIALERVRSDFYRVGRWKSAVLKRLGSDSTSFPHLSESSPQLYSSTGQAPYPVALIKEFDQLNQAACENSRKRLAHLADRAPASQRSPQREATLQFLQSRCLQR